MATNGNTTTRNRRRPAGAGLTSEQNAESGFRASKELSENVQRVLVDLIELSLQGKQAHWNVVGRNFRDTHLQLDEIIDAAREFADTVAETTTLPEFPQGEIDTSEVIDLITARLEAVVGTCREVHDDVDDEDPTTADILHSILERLEQLAWMVSAENRTASKN